MGTEAFWVPAVLGAVSAGGQYVNQKNAQDRESRATIAGIKDQQDIQGRGVAAARALTDQIARNTPNQIAGKATGDYVAQLRRNAGSAGPSGPTSSLAPVAGASSRYTADTGKAQTAVQDYGNETAGEMGQLDAAVRQRQNEGLSMSDLGTTLNSLGAESATKGFVDQLRAASAGVANPWVTLGSNLVGGLAKGYAANGVGKGAAANALSKNSLYSGPNTADDYVGALA